jgi:hypothetical protein
VFDPTLPNYGSYHYYNKVKRRDVFIVLAADGLGDCISGEHSVELVEM